MSRLTSIRQPAAASRRCGVFRPYVPTAAERDHASGGRSYGLHVVGRLRPDATVEQARADVGQVSAAVRAAFPANSMIGTGIVVLALHDRVVGPAKSWLLLVLAAVVCVVIVACVNAASLWDLRKRSLFVVTQQARAIGLRMALGASQSNVLRSILSEALWRVAVGATLGLVGSRVVASLFTSLVFGVQTTSPVVYATVGLGLAAIGVLAAFVPARRAAGFDPLAALRAE